MTAEQYMFARKLVSQLDTKREQIKRLHDLETAKGFSMTVQLWQGITKVSIELEGEDLQKVIDCITETVQSNFAKLSKRFESL